MAHPQKYQLKIVRASDLRPTGGSQEAPSLYVKVSFGDFRWQTRVVQMTTNPVWDESVQLPAAASTANLSIYIESSDDQPLGGISVPVERLLELGKTPNHDITLKLESPIQSVTHKYPNDIGFIVIQLSLGDVTEADFVACNAAAASVNALSTTQLPQSLEAGRSALWDSNMHLASPLDNTHAGYPTLAGQLSHLSALLEHAGQDMEEYQSTWEEIKQIRDIPGFAQFLHPKPYSELSQAAELGPVILVNISTQGCDALIVKPSPEPPSHLPLETFSCELARSLHLKLKMILKELGLRNRGDPKSVLSDDPTKVHSADEGIRAILAELWHTVVKPIVDALSLKVLPVHKLPRIWWCPTGSLSFLPLHAAGIYPIEKGQSQICLADYAISSYTPTLTAVQTASQRASEDIHKAVKLLAVIQPNTPGASSLPGTKEELEVISHYASNHQILHTLVGEQATVNEVLSGMDECSWVHLACHGQQHSGMPIKSGFLLQDGCLQLSQIIAKSFPNASFAFLSVCQTATGDEDQPDEAIHLASGMLSAGYQSVIATMWSIGDDDAPLIANDVYAHLLGGEIPNTREAASALHIVAKALREKYNSQFFTSWVPFIHMGV